MRDGRPARVGVTVALAAIVGAPLLGLLLAVPTARAQTTEGDPPPPSWETSTFDVPDEFISRTTSEIIDVAGAFRWRKPTATAEIVGAIIAVVDDDQDDFEPADGCRTPRREEVLSDGTAATEEVDELAFDRTGIEVMCNGRYLVEATATTNDDTDPGYTMRVVVSVEAMPPSVSDMTTSVDPETQDVTLEWVPVSDDDLPVDTIGYLVQRGGPRAEDGSFGAFTEIGIVDTDRNQALDPTPGPGTYTYRVLTLRAGPEGAVRSSLDDAAEQIVEVGTPRPSTTPTTKPRIRVGGGIPTSAPPRIGPPTTVDTGFDEELDYGGRPAPDRGPVVLPGIVGDDELAGQSIVRDEGEGVNLIIPAAGALVLLGWAGHIAYLNRLARQL